jgi:dTDP-glucose 4,6-dehydratase
MRVLVTGGAGFIGSTVCKFLVLEMGVQILNLDKLTYAANLASLDSIKSAPGYQFAQVDICNRTELERNFASFQPDGVIHLAAESHVDRSINGPGEFIQTNIVGAYELLEASRAYWSGLSGEKRDGFRFLHVSTDEVYGSLGDEGVFLEDTPYAPNSPYSASKASADHLARAWCKTFGLPVVMSNCSNNYGPFQFPEKLIPLMIINALHGKSLPVYGNGTNRRDWLHVDDHARALFDIFTRGRVGEKYNVGGNAEMENIEVVTEICDLVQELGGVLPRTPVRNLIAYVTDRPGHDQRYAMDASKIKQELGWKPRHDFHPGLRQTVEWYLSNEDWWRPILEGTYQGQRLGLEKN